MSKFYSALMLARHVSDLTGPSSGAFCTSCMCRLWYVVIRVLLDTSSRYLVTCPVVRVYLVGLHIFCKMIHGPYNITVYLFSVLVVILWWVMGKSIHCLLTELSLVFLLALHFLLLIMFLDRLSKSVDCLIVLHFNAGDLNLFMIGS